MAIKATGSRVLPKTIAGAWKFRRTGGDFCASVEGLIMTAKELINQNPGGGTFKQVFVRSTADNELGICFVYEIGPNESVDSKDKDWKDKYADFFMRRHGAAYKGYDIGHSVTEVILTEA